MFIIGSLILYSFSLLIELKFCSSTCFWNCITPLLDDNWYTLCLSLQFPPSSENSLFSNSVVDVFTQLTQCFGVVSRLECPDPEIWKRFMKRFAKTIVKVLLAYADICKKEFSNYVDDEKKVSIITCFFRKIPSLLISFPLLIIWGYRLTFVCIGRWFTLQN